jgi:hypothetical protein
MCRHLHLWACDSAVLLPTTGSLVEYAEGLQPDVTAMPTTIMTAAKAASTVAEPLAERKCMSCRVSCAMSADKCTDNG